MKKYRFYVISIELCIKKELLPAFKGNNSCKSCNLELCKKSINPLYGHSRTNASIWCHFQLYQI